MAIPGKTSSLTPEDIKKFDSILSGVPTTQSDEEKKDSQATRSISAMNPIAENRIKNLKDRATYKEFEQKVESPSLWDKYQNITREFATGFAKGGLKTAQSLGQLTLKGAEKITGKDLGAEETFFRAEDALKPEGTAQKVGYGTEKLAEFFVPAGSVARAEKMIDLVSLGIKSSKVAAGLRVAGKAGVQALSAGGVRLAQTADIEEAKKTAKFAGVTRGVLATGGEAVRAFGLPDKLYQPIFKNTANEMSRDMRAEALLKLKQTKPTEYDELVKAGIIKIKNGNPTLNQTTAEKALDKGLKGSLQNMFNETTRQTLHIENRLLRTLDASDDVVKLSSKEQQSYINVLKGYSKIYKGVQHNKISEGLDDMVQQIQANGGVIKGRTALELRRALDRFRIESSFNKDITKLSLKQHNLKFLADEMRGKIAKIPGVGNLMKEYSFYIDATEKLANEAARRGNSQVIGMVDSLFLGGATVSPEPASLITIGLLRRAALSAQFQTRLGSFLNKSVMGIPGSTALGAGSAEAAKRMTD